MEMVPFPCPCLDVLFGYYSDGSRFRILLGGIGVGHNSYRKRTQVALSSAFLQFPLFNILDAGGKRESGEGFMSIAIIGGARRNHHYF